MNLLQIVIFSGRLQIKAIIIIIIIKLLNIFYWKSTVQNLSNC